MGNRIPPLRLASRCHLASTWFCANRIASPHHIQRQRSAPGGSALKVAVRSASAGLNRASGLAA
jgi:hypothetical protein